jgi:hypothetical protein
MYCVFHILVNSDREIADAVGGIQPRICPTNIFPDTLLLSGMERMVINQFTNFVNIGERCNVAGSKKFLRLIKCGKFEVLIPTAVQLCIYVSTCVFQFKNDGTRKYDCL